MNEHKVGHLLVSLVIVLFGAESKQVKAVPFGTELKLVASDADDFDLFGRSVAISGNTAIVGSNRDNDAGGNSGSAYLFDARSGLELHKLTASDASGEARFGSAVGISGGVAIVGAYDHSVLEDTGAEAAYLFDVATGNEIRKLMSPTSADGFGGAVGISGNIAIVGADEDDNERGAAYLFDVTTGNQLFKLTAPDAAAGDNFGFAVAIDGNIAVVGAPDNDRAYLFNVSTGQQLFVLDGSDDSLNSDFGYSVGISGDTAIVGAWMNSLLRGAAYLFDVNTGNELAKLTASDADNGDRFGFSVDIHGNNAVVGTPFNISGSPPGLGTAYLFDVATGNELLKLTKSDPGNSRFGESVAIGSSAIIVGASEDDDGGDRSGAAYLFVPEPSSYFLIAMAGLISAAVCFRQRGI